MKSIMLGTMVALFSISTLATDYNVDLENSRIGWLGSKKIGGQHTGEIKLKTATVKFAGGHFSGGEFTVDMASISNNDLTDATYNAKLVGHLKSVDFFEVEKFPTSSFKITHAGMGKGGDNYDVTGELTIKSLTHKVSFHAQKIETDAKITFTAPVVFDRTKWDVKYNSGKFFDIKALGDNVINDEIKLEITLVINKTESSGPAVEKKDLTKKKKKKAKKAKKAE